MFYVYIPPQTKKGAQRWGKEEATGPLRASQKLKLAGAQGRWECTAGASPKSESTDAERMKECKLIKDKRVCCQAVSGGNCRACLTVAFADASNARTNKEFLGKRGKQ